MKFTRCKALRGEITVPGDKSISHRSVMFGSLARGTTEIHNYLQGADCLSTPVISYCTTNCDATNCKIKKTAIPKTSP